MGSLEVGSSKPFSDPIRVALVSEHAMARAGMAQAIAAEPDMEVYGEFDHCRALMGLMLKAPPDAAVLELSAGGGEILDALERCCRAVTDIALVVVSHSRDPEIAERALKAGARGYIFRNAGPKALTAAIRDTVAGELHVCRCIASPMLQKTLYGSNRHKTKHPDLAKLSAREFQIFQLLGAGWPNQKIAQELGISIKTLHVHKEHLKDKLNLPSANALKEASIHWQNRSVLG